MLDKDIRVHIVPKGIRYISDWKEFEIFDFPHILDKQIPGCGFTEYCLTSNEDVVLCSPRKILMQNKYDQHSEDIFLVKSDYEDVCGVDKDLEAPPPPPNPRENIFTINKIKEEQEKMEELRANKAKEEWKILRNNIIKYVESRVKSRKPIKFLVTYDSFRKLKDILADINLWTIDCSLDNDRLDYRVVIDEFQSIFTDSRFKSSTEIEFINVLKGIEKVCYVSATPMIDIYLSRLVEFKDLPYYELDWKTEDPGRIQKPRVSVRKLQSITKLCRVLTEPYQTGEFYREYRTDPTCGNPVEVISKELVIYVNSVNNITKIVKACKLSPDQVNILCADTEKNRNTIKNRLGKSYIIGHVPTRNEPRKLITLCTRTVYLGADFYSDNARSIVISDANVECLAVDITLDLPQILGRQRLSENPWKNEIEIYVKCITPGNVELRCEFEQMRQNKLKETNALILMYNNNEDDYAKFVLAKNLEIIAKDYNFKENYAAVNNHAGNKKIVVENKLVQIAEERAFDIQQIDYKDRFSVFSQVQNSLHIDRGDLIEGRSVDEFFLEYQNQKNVKGKIRLMCEFPFKTEQDRIDIFMQLPVKYRNYYNTLGPERLKSLGYDVTKIRRELEDKVKAVSSGGDLEDLIKGRFKVGESYANKFIKSALSELYKTVGFSAKSPKASDLKDWFEVKACKVKNEDIGQWENALTVLSIK